MVVRMRFPLWMIWIGIAGQSPQTIKACQAVTSPWDLDVWSDTNIWLRRPLVGRQLTWCLCLQMLLADSDLLCIWAKASSSSSIGSRDDPITSNSRATWIIQITIPMTRISIMSLNAAKELNPLGDSVKSGRWNKWWIKWGEYKEGRTILVLPLISIGIRKGWWPSIAKSPLHSYLLNDYSHMEVHKRDCFFAITRPPYLTHLASHLSNAHTYSLTFLLERSSTYLCDSMQRTFFPIRQIDRAIVG